MNSDAKQGQEKRQTAQSNTVQSDTESRMEATAHEVEKCADRVIQAVQELRQEQNLEANRPISLYITNSAIARSMLKVHKDRVEQETNAVDVVAINDEAGIPMPEQLSHRTLEFGQEEVIVAIAADGTTNRQ